MNVKELRIGNCVNFKNRTDIRYCTVEELTSRGGCYITRYFYHSELEDDSDSQIEAIEDLTPITLTSEILLNNGWGEISNESQFRNFRLVPGIYISLSKKDDKNIGSLKGDFVISDDYHIIKYVHRLQNYLYEVYNYEWNPNL